MLIRPVRAPVIVLKMSKKFNINSAHHFGSILINQAEELLNKDTNLMIMYLIRNERGYLEMMKNLIK